MLKRIVVIIAIAFVCVPCFSQTYDVYGGVVQAPCANPNGTLYFGLATIKNHKVLCDPANHAMFARGFMVFNTTTSTDDTGTPYNTVVENRYNIAPSNLNNGWVDIEIPRIKAWGFNALGPDDTSWSAYPFYPRSGGTNPNKLPFIYEEEACYYSWYNASNWGPAPIHSLLKVASPFFHSNAEGYYGYDGITDYEDPNWPLFVDGEMSSTGDSLWADILGASASDRSYMIAVSFCDSDYMHGFGAGPMFDTSTPDSNDFRLSYLVALDSPVSWYQWLESPAIGVFFPNDQTIYSKLEWLRELDKLDYPATGKYASIAALNTAWGSNYSTFTTTGTCFGPHWEPSESWLCGTTPGAATSLGTGTGSVQTFSPPGGTLGADISANSVGIFINGVLSGADDGDGGFSLTGGSGVGFIMILPGAVPTVTTTAPAGANEWQYGIAEMTGPPNTGATELGSTAWTGTVTNGVTTLDSTNYNIIDTSLYPSTATCWIYRYAIPSGSPLVWGFIGSVTCGTPFDDTGQLGSRGGYGGAVAGTINYATGAMSLVFTAPSGAAITAEYIQNGWGYGYGLMDEDGHTADQGWTGNNAVCIDGKGMTDVCSKNGALFASAGMVTDLNNLDTVLAGKFASVTKTAAQRETQGLPGVLDAGITVGGGWATPPNQYVIAGMAPYLDIYQSGGQGPALSPSELAYLYNNSNVGSVQYTPAIIQSMYNSANQDSIFSYPSTGTCTNSGETVTCPLSYPLATDLASWLPQNKIDAACADSSYNAAVVAVTYSAGTSAASYTAGQTPSGAGTTCTIWWDDSNVGGYHTQADRATAVSGALNSLFSEEYPNGVYPYVGAMWWGFQDEPGDNGSANSWGLVDLRDNAYNGVETTMSTTTHCAAPLQAYTCGGDTHPYGSDDGLKPITNAFTALDKDLAGLGSTPPTLNNGSISGGSIH